MAQSDERADGAVIGAIFGALAGAVLGNLQAEPVDYEGDYNQESEYNRLF